MDMYTTVLVVVVAIAAIAVAIYAARKGRKTKGVDSMPPTTEEARLEDRFARGEISESEYRRNLEELKERRQKNT
ncbi:SHOCT domain-containing protein [Planococcus salinarum]|uniref:SHOCT domain-containing protein n=1 Tax=Planococcus salinarum TaxID=622695 RepID=UPI000E3EDA39|nr:SHOCT domain-containing protein [Planococcus salinarum]TAA71689.1 SHOCT domain-containing protein [Planococcus salinarum]